MDWRLRALLKSGRGQEGFTLVVAMGIGVIILLLTATLITKAQEDQVNAIAQSQTGNSLAVAEGGMARVLAELTQANNSVLLTRNYDSVDLKTNKTYFGPDGIFKNGDEENTAVNEWTSIPATCGSAAASPSINYSGTIGTNGQYSLKAYRYNSIRKTGTFLVEGKQANSVSYVETTLSISTGQDFPGVLASESAYLQGRSILGKNGNVYYNPALSANSSLTGFAAPGDANRGQYLNAIWSGAIDGYTGDPVSGKIVACQRSFTIPHTPQGAYLNLGTLKGNGTVVALGGGITSYQTSKVELQATDTWTFDTTAGPIYLYVAGTFSMKGSAKILNIRSDGQPPRVGDLRIIGSGGSGYEFGLFGNACIQTAFIYNRESDLQIQTIGDGCASPGNTNVEGVVWVEDLLSSRNDAATRLDPDYDGDIIKTITVPPITSGIAVPDDVSSLSDILTTGLNQPIPIKGKLNAVLSWRRVQL
jgi:hypothetical protein